MNKITLALLIILSFFIIGTDNVNAQTGPQVKLVQSATKKYGMVIPYQKGIIESQIKAEKVVLLSFDAIRCPSCVALGKDIKENISLLPENTVIVQADYDKETGLKKTFKVTKQNTVLVLKKSKKGYVVSARSKGYISQLSKVLELAKK